MARDKSADERRRYDLKIKQTEHRVEQFYRSKENYQRTLERFQGHFQQLSNQYEEVLSEQYSHGDRDKVRDLEENQELHHRMNHVLRDLSEDVNHAYYLSRQEQEDKIDEMRKERNALPWE